jgi:hypothetical protein
MSATPQLVELEDRESGRIRRVPYGDPQLFEEPERAFERATSKHPAPMSRRKISIDSQPCPTAEAVSISGGIGCSSGFSNRKEEAMANQQ